MLAVTNLAMKKMYGKEQIQLPMLVPCSLACT